MDSRITLALMAHARQVFQQPESILSFPVPPFALTADELRAIAGDVSDPDDLSAAYEFATLVNQRPTLPIWSGAGDTMLWNLYDDILNRSAEVARGELSESDQAAFREAEAVLFTVDDSGVRTPSERALVCAQYRDTWFTLQQAYRTRKAEAESSEPGDELRAAWEADEPGLRAEIVTFEEEWNEKGFRREVEAAKATLSALSTKDASLQWDRWSQSLKFFLDSQTDIESQARFCPTTYTPADIVDSEGWIDTRMSGAEFSRLVKSAPAELSTRLNPSGVVPPVASISFACATIGVTRPWLDSSIFRAPFWRFSDSTRRLSDGGSPPAGEWPAYVSGLVLARNITVVAEEPPPVQPPPPPPAASDDRPRDRPRPAVVVRPHRRVVVRDERVGDRPRMRDHRTVRRDAEPRRVRATSITGSMVARFEGRRLVRPQRPAIRRPERFQAALRSAQVQRLARPVPPAAGLVSTSIPGSAENDEVLVLALICTPLQRCPNPDPALFGK